MPRLAKATTADSLTLSDAVAQWLVSMEARNLSPKTTATYAYAMGNVIGILGANVHVAHIRPEHIEQVVVALARRGWKPASISGTYRPFRTLMNWCVSREHIERSPFERTKAPVVPVIPPERLDPDDIRRLLATCSSSKHTNYRGIRDEAIIRLFATTGLRLAELTNLRLADLELDGVVPFVTVMGKGRKVRSVPLDPPTVDAIRRYIRRERVRSPFSLMPNLWLASKGPMQANGIAQMVESRGEVAGLDIHAHSLRHYAIQRMLGAGMSEGDTMAVSGHSTRSMLDRYSAADRQQRAQVAFLSAPRPVL